MRSLVSFAALGLAFCATTSALCAQVSSASPRGMRRAARAATESQRRIAMRFLDRRP